MLLKKNGEEQRKQLLDKANLEGYAVAAKFTGKSDEHQVQKALASNFRYFKLFVFDGLDTSQSTPKRSPNHLLLQKLSSSSNCSTEIFSLDFLECKLQ